MNKDFFTVIIEEKPVVLEKKRVMSIEPDINGTKLTMEASHLDC